MNYIQEHASNCFGTDFDAKTEQTVNYNVRIDLSIQKNELH